MKIAVFKDAYRVDDSIGVLLSARKDADIQLTTVELADTDCLAHLEQAVPHVVVVAALLAEHSDGAEQQLFKENVTLIADWCKQHSAVLLMLSSAAVFDGSRIAYHETDEVQPNSRSGLFYQQLEQVAASNPKHLILRTDWLYNEQQGSFLSNVIQYAIEGQCVGVNSAAKACPTAVTDLARVIVAILLQIQQGSDNWGVFHYVAADTALGFQFVEAILQQAEKYNDVINAKQVCFEHCNPSRPEFYFAPVVLKCSRLLENFGIHQRPWRTQMPAVVRAYFGIE